MGTALVPQTSHRAYRYVEHARHGLVTGQCLGGSLRHYAGSCAGQACCVSNRAVTGEAQQHNTCEHKLGLPGKVVVLDGPPPAHLQVAVPHLSSCDVNEAWHREQGPDSDTVHSSGSRIEEHHNLQLPALAGESLEQGPQKHLPQKLQPDSEQAGRHWWQSPCDQAIGSMALPAILALAADPLLQMVDTGFAGHLPGEALAALSINNSLFSFSFVVFNFLSTAVTPSIAAALSVGDKAKAGEATIQALGLATVLGVLLTGGLSATSHTWLELMGTDSADQSLMDMATSFLLIRCLASPAALLTTTAQGVFRGLGDLRTPLVVTLATNLLHLLLDYALIFHTSLGLQGAAVSTTTCEWLAACAYLSLMWQRRADLGLAPPPQLAVDTLPARMKPFLQSGGTMFMRSAVLLSTKTLASVVATRLGPASIASHQVLGQVWLLVSLMVDSLAISGQTLIAGCLGKGDKQAARQVSERLMQLGGVLGIAMSGVLGAASPVWPRLFTQDESVVATVQSLLPLTIAMLPLNALVYVLDGVLVGASDFEFLFSAMLVASATAAGGSVVVGWLEGCYGAEALRAPCNHAVPATS